MWAKIIEAVVGAIGAAIAGGIADYRRDAALTKLGYSDAELAHLRGRAAAMAKARKIYAQPDPISIGLTLGRL